jgi:hypothetical protein
MSELKRDKNYQDTVRNDDLMHSSDLAKDLMQLIYHTVIEQSSSRCRQLIEEFFCNEDDYDPEAENQPETLCDRIFGAYIQGVAFNLIDSYHALLVGSSELILVNFTA